MSNLRQYLTLPFSRLEYPSVEQRTGITSWASVAPSYVYEQAMKSRFQPPYLICHTPPRVSLSRNLIKTLFLMGFPEKRFIYRAFIPL